MQHRDISLVVEDDRAVRADRVAGFEIELPNDLPDPTGGASGNERNLNASVTDGVDRAERSG